MSSEYIDLFYLISAVLFIVGLKQMASPRTALQGNMLGSAAMLIWRLWRQNVIAMTMPHCTVNLRPGVLMTAWSFPAV